MESGPMEQTFKLNELDLDSEEQVLKLIDQDFIQACMSRFDDMYAQLRSKIENLEN